MFNEHNIIQQISRKVSKELSAVTGADLGGRVQEVHTPPEMKLLSLYIRARF